MSMHKALSAIGRIILFAACVATLANCAPPPASPTSVPPTLPPESTALPAPTAAPATEVAPTAAPTAAPTEAAPTLAPTIAPTSTATKPKQPTSIVIVIPEDPPSFNPVIQDTGYDGLVKNLTLLGMTGIDPDGKVFPVLAAELPSVDNGDVQLDQAAGTMDVTWKMRKDVLWADGQPVTADDVIFTYQAIIQKDTGAQIEGIETVAGVDKVDDHTFTVHFSQIFPSYLTLFGGRKVAIWPKHYCKAEQGFSAWDCAQKPLSDGPYILQEWINGDHLTFVRNPKYFEPGKPQIDKIIVQIVPDASVRETMLRKGDADVIMWATEQTVSALADDKQVKVSISPTNRFTMRLFLNLAAKGHIDPVKYPNPFLSDVRVRQAIRKAIDVDAILSSVWHGYGTPVWTEFFRPPYQCDIPRPQFDPEGAKALLDQAGWIDKNGARVCRNCKYAKEGQVMRMDLNIYSDYGEPLDNTQLLIGEMLKNVGIQVDLASYQSSVLWADSKSGGIEQNGNFNIDLYDDGYPGTDPAPFLRQYYASASAAPDAGWNVGRWKNAPFDALLDKTDTLDEAQRKDAFCQMAQILDTELPEIPLFSTINADAYSGRMIGVQTNINDVVSWNVADWAVAQ